MATFSFEEAQLPPEAKGPETFSFEEASGEEPGFFSKAAGVVKGAGKAIAEHPLQAIPGAAEAIAGGVAGLASAAAGGVVGAAEGLGAATRNLVTGSNTSVLDAAMAGFNSGLQKVLGATSKLPLESETEVGKELSKVLGLIPEGIHAAGNTVFEKTGSALLGAGTEGLATLVTLKPAAVTKTLGWAFDKTRSDPAAAKAQELFDTAAQADPDTARAAVEQSDDPKLRKELLKRIDEITVSKPSQVKQLVRDNTLRPSGEVTQGQLDDIFNAAKANRSEEAPAQVDLAVEANKANARVVATTTQLDAAKDYQAALNNPDTPPEVLDQLHTKAVNAEEAARALEPEVKEPTVQTEPNVAGKAEPALGEPPPEETRIEPKLEEPRTPDAAASDVRSTVAAANDLVEANRFQNPTPGTPTTAMQEAFAKAAPGEIVYLNAGIPVTRAAVQDAFTATRELARKSDVYRKIEDEVTTSVDQLIRSVNPEGLGKDARSAAAVVAKNLAEQMQKDSQFVHRAEARRDYWNSRTPEAQLSFIKGYEQGATFKDHLLNRAADAYRAWSKDIFDKDQALGLKYDARDNYLYHVFENPDAVAKFLDKTYGGKWNDPGFTKERSFELYDQAIKNGFKPKFTNPEDIMLARQHASDVAQMRVQSLRDMAEYGLARRLGKGGKPEIGEAEWRSPNGERYAVLDNAAQILHNAFNTKSLWNMPGAVGGLFRGHMYLKNALVPIKLALSLFHPLHVATIDNATAMVRASKALLSGNINTRQWISDMARGAVYKELAKETTASFSGGVLGKTPEGGYRLLQVWKGKVPDKALTAADRLSLQYMTEGGFIPEMASQYKNNAIRKFKDSLSQRQLSTPFKLPGYIVESLQKPIFEVWIPALKAASYLRDVKTALKVDPSLMDNSLRRFEAFRKIAKSVDNRYGEMAYNTLFWNRWIKDIGVGATLSLGWNLGFLREYGGGALDVVKHVGSKDSISAATRKGNLDRALFVSFYTAQSLAYGGLLTWALTGTPPTEWKDYVYPKSGEKNPDGTDARLSTPFYAREIAAIGMHMVKEGVLSGLGHLVLNKLVPLAGLYKAWATNVDYFGKEISDPNAPLYKQLEQKLMWTLKEQEPISLSSTHGKSTKATALSIAGFGPAPGYVTESPTEAAIKSLYQRYNKTVIPYERAQYSDEARQLKQALQSGNVEDYRAKLIEMRDKYHLTPDDIAKLRANVKGDSVMRMFKALTVDQQSRVMKDMTPEELRRFSAGVKQKARTQFIHEQDTVRN